METGPALVQPSPSDILYQPLTSDNNEIRVLRIDPAQPHDHDIHCSLETISLNSKTAYQALSYEWGPPDAGVPPSRVLLNAHEVSTTPNLRLALQHLEKGLAYWIDALCIDQSNDKERGHQVRLMTDIYRHASAVVVWLGLEGAKSDRGINFLHEVSNVMKKRKDGSKFRDWLPDWLRETLTNSEYEMSWEGLREIIRRSYWSRLWVIQEVVVPSRPDQVFLLCGAKKVPFKYLGMVILSMYALQRAIPKFYNGDLEDTIVDFKKLADAVRDVANHAEAWGKPNPREREISIVSLLIRYRRLLCADPRDKVYSLLGVSSHYPDVELPITYTTPVLDVYRNLTKYVIAGSGKLDILTCAGQDQLVPQDSPSWVPDWRVYNHRGRIVRSAWEASGDLRSSARYSPDNSIMITPAFILGSITALFETGEYPLQEGGYDALEYDDMAVVAGRVEMSRWIHFITSNSEGGLSTDLSRKHAKWLYGVLFYVANGPKTAKRLLSFKKFRRLCDTLPLSDSESEVEAVEDILTSDEIWHWVSSMTRRQQLCSIKLDPLPKTDEDGWSTVGENSGDEKPSRTPAERPQRTVGVCSRNAKIGDVVSIVKGCRHPLLLRPRGEKYEIVGDMYVHAYMDGYDLDMFHEVDIELV